MKVDSPSENPVGNPSFRGTQSVKLGFISRELYFLNCLFTPKLGILYLKLGDLLLKVKI